jgi:hypothetical protein
VTSPHDILTAYSESRISGHEAMQLLHLDGYRDLLIAMCDSGREMPRRPPQEELDAEVEAAVPILQRHLIP